MTSKELLHSVSKLVKEVSPLIFSSSRNVVSNISRDIKAQADFELNKAIHIGLKKITSYAVISEEDDLPDQPNLEGRVWIVDPLDGSLNYSRQIPLSCVSIALWENGNPLLGVVYDLNHAELFEGIVEEGAWLNGEPIRVSSCKSKEEAILCTGFPTGRDFSHPSLQHFITEIQAYKKIRLLGSAALSLAYVACGRVDSYHEESIAIWDVAAGLAIVSAAGGAIDYQKTSNPYRWIVKTGV